MIRPELRAHLTRQREAYVAGLTLAASLWVATRGGWFLAALGLCLAALAAGWLVLALRRARFARPVSDPGVVDLDEGRIGYWGTGGGMLGGTMALEDLVEIRLLLLKDSQFWRLKSRDGQALLVPVAAAGSEKLFDAFAGLPGIDMGAMAAALDRRISAQSLWRRPG
ncbi:hypothetical protein PUH89_01990 [Rhodobacter capsulatus]|uniref:Uncharacterized protein n=1 Tax=Rhodobacter capsulatus TaxID=1061 RepID=A0A1G7FNX1_RHOCA|nr:hypothetical protein [Rhodobacter capsulatus]WER09775.1 hypothetical protein PUH89_01990 [Rhodobacter capsulatus]SDE77518.1 hypothetical protein SAMN04244550_01049 [Rhodobacter capsulatus]